MNGENTSPRFKLNKTDMIKGLRLVVITTIGYFITALSQTLLDFDYTTTFGGGEVNYTPIVIVLISFLTETARRFLTNYNVK